ncbi:MAG TPA: non-homologous end-joining DNA ligase [Candidatus Angelobacter sp.]
MALAEYKRKRHFDQTPEPPPKVEAREGHRFVAQKHRASHLHYDFRLEMDGVLKSWAVPKGPSLDPADKRLAMQVEDHPVSYVNFEGNIPQDNYGAGAVMVWDTGSWEPLGDASAMLRKGDVKFILHGSKLKGEFVLAKMRSRRPGSKGTEWLLIKKRDEFAQPGFDVEKLDKSVLTGRKLDEIAADSGSAEWQSNRAAAPRKGAEWLKDSLKKAARASTAKMVTPTGSAKAASSKKKEPPATANLQAALAQLKGAHEAGLPRTIHPMLATLVEDPFDDPQWLFEIKWDGYRAVSYLQKGKAELLSRNQNDLTSEFSEIAKSLAQIPIETAIFDGEIVALDEQGRSSFSLMQQRTGLTKPGKARGAKDLSVPIVYYVFDLLYLEGYNIMRVPLEQRKDLLAQIIPRGDGLLRYSDHHPAEGTRLFEVAQEKGLEGIIAKLRSGLYLQKRSREWLKIKVSRRQEAVICGHTEPRGSREYFGSLILGLYNQNGKLVHVGNVGTGFDRKAQAALWKQLKKLETDKNPFGKKIDTGGRAAHWLKPQLVAEIKFAEWTHPDESGEIKMRAPVFVGLRMDKKPEECVFEFPKPTDKEVEKAEQKNAS